jgi:methylmalonyl-CoA mutase N-terminal domain/subunit
VARPAWPSTAEDMKVLFNEIPLDKVTLHDHERVPLPVLAG